MKVSLTSIDFYPGEDINIDLRNRMGTRCKKNTGTDLFTDQV